jgi:hypothetical protein
MHRYAITRSRPNSVEKWADRGDRVIGNFLYVEVHSVIRVKLRLREWNAPSTCWLPWEPIGLGAELGGVRVHCVERIEYFHLVAASSMCLNGVLKRTRF